MTADDQEIRYRYLGEHGRAPQTQAEIASELGMTPRMVGIALRRAGVPARNRGPGSTATQDLGIMVPVSRPQREKIRSRARKHGLAMATYLRMLGLGKKPKKK